jgi:hypothetical protein
VTDHLQARRERYFHLSSAIAKMENEQLRLLFTGSEADRGWGRNHIIEVEQSKVFVKRIPVTDLEYANGFSTRNLYNLPLYYNYGVGSAGFGIFRELVTHIKTTNWVLTGAMATFPLLYHYRIMPTTGQHGGINLDKHEGYVTYWNNNQAIRQFILDRAHANYQAVLFLEYFPDTLQNWLVKYLEDLPMMMSDMAATLAFLQENGIIHFDAHWDNILTDGAHIYLSDFGLTLDRSFTLSEAETHFFDQNRNYDAGEFLSGLGFHLLVLYDNLPAENRRRIRQQYNLADDIKNIELQPILLDNIEEIAEKGLMPFTQYYCGLTVKYREIIHLMRQFYVAMRRNHKKDTLFDHGKLTRLLHATEFLANHATTA